MVPVSESVLRNKRNNVHQALSPVPKLPIKGLYLKCDWFSLGSLSSLAILLKSSLFPPKFDFKRLTSNVDINDDFMEIQKKR